MQLPASANICGEDLFFLPRKAFFLATFFIHACLSRFPINTYFLCISHIFPHYRRMGLFALEFGATPFPKPQGASEGRNFYHNDATLRWQGEVIQIQIGSADTASKILQCMYISASKKSKSSLFVHKYRDTQRQFPPFFNPQRGITVPTPGMESFDERLMALATGT